MKLELYRKYRKNGYTIGLLYADGKFVCNTLEDTDRGLTSAMSERQIASIKVKGKTAIPTGVYSIIVTYSPRFKKQMPLLYNVKGFEGVRIHCLTPDMEILTENGWQNLESYTKNTPKKCYSYNIETQKIELVDIDNFIHEHYQGNLFSNKGRRLNYSVTDKHRMFVATKNRKLEYSWGFRTADNVPTQSKFLVAANKDGEPLSSEQKILYRLIMATQADGYILNRSMNSVAVIFHFTKERKIQRIKNLVSQLGRSCTIRVDADNKTHIHLDPQLSMEIAEYMNPNRFLFNYKELPKCILNLCSEDLRDLLFEYLFWDGRWENYKKCNKNITISSTNLNTLNMLQAMAVCCGMRSFIHKGNGVSCYEITLYENQNVVMPEANTFNSQPYDGDVWCLSNINTTLIVRQNNRPMIIGNCGNTANDTEGCILCGKNTEVGKVTSSRIWTEKVYDLINNAIRKRESVTIKIHW